MSNTLDSCQWTAVNTSAPRALVVAGPGSGKTRVLTMRLARLVKDGVDPSCILAVTFTNRAAREMKERIDSCGIASRGVNIGTFHSISLGLLRKLVPGLKLFGRGEQESIMQELGCGDINQALSDISAFKNGVLSEGKLDKVLLEGYKSRLDELSAVDLDDLVPAATRLLAEKGLKPFSHIMIDEYQDINPAQALFVRELASSAHSLLAIGDPDQAIYAFRGSNLGCFLEFERDYPGAEKILLSRNYRSAEKIVAASTELIAKNTMRLENGIKPVRGGGTIELVECPSEKEEASFIIKEVERLMGGLTNLTAKDDTGMKFSDFAVLVRTNKQAEYIAGEFAASSVPFCLVSSTPALLKDFVQKLKSVEISKGVSLRDFIMGEARAFGLKDDALTILETSMSGLDDGAGIDGLLETIDLSGPSDWLDIKADKVKIMTLHAAKGLEWRCVFIAGAEEGLIPMTLRGESDIEEERRLFYVGITRACDTLYLTHARKRQIWGVQKEQKRSPFIGEMPSELMNSRCLEKKAVKRRPVQKGLFE